MKTKKAYIIYSYDNFKNDYIYIKEYYDLKEIQKELKLKNQRSIYHYLSNSIDSIEHLLNNKYIIIKEDI